MRKAKRKTYVAVAVFAFLIALTFQNCGQNLETENSLSSVVTELGAEGTLKNQFGKHAAFVQQMPFAFEAGIDTIVYNSCLIGQASNNRVGLYNLKAGAYSHSGAGLRLKPSVVQFIKDEFANEIQTLGYDENLTVKRAIYYSPANSESRLQIAFRDENFLSWTAYPFVSPGTSPKVGYDIIPVIGDVTDDRVLADLIMANGASIYYSRQPVNDGVSKPTFEATFAFNTGDSFGATVKRADDLRQVLSGTYAGANGEHINRHRLSVGFSLNNLNQDKAKVLLASGDTYGQNDIPSGRTYELSFGKSRGISSVPANANPADYPVSYANQLTSVREFSHALRVNESTGKWEDGTSATDWSCDPDEIFVIVREEDRAGYCPPSLPLPQNLVRYQKIRQHLPADLWDINLENHCVVPKGFKCYGSETRQVAVSGGGTTAVSSKPVYDFSKACFHLGSNDTSLFDHCAEFISFCRKVN
jgi:hypothetical protein